MIEKRKNEIHNLGKKARKMNDNMFVKWVKPPTAKRDLECRTCSFLKTNLGIVPRYAVHCWKAYVYVEDAKEIPEMYDMLVELVEKYGASTGKAYVDTRAYSGPYMYKGCIYCEGDRLKAEKIVQEYRKRGYDKQHTQVQHGCSEDLVRYPDHESWGFLSDFFLPESREKQICKAVQRNLKNFMSDMKKDKSKIMIDTSKH